MTVNCTHISVWLFLTILLDLFLIWVDAAKVWRLTFIHEYGYYVESNVGAQVELFCFYSNGSAASNIGITNKYNNNTAIFGKTDQYGDIRITFQNTVAIYDFHVYDNNQYISDSTPNLYWINNAEDNINLPNSGFYRWEFHWTLIDDDKYIINPWNFVYNYDLINSTNTKTSEPANYKSDQYELTNWASYQAQTFVIPDNITNIISCKAFITRSNGQTFTMIASIRENNPNGTMIGIPTESRSVYSTEFEAVVMNWDIGTITVTPGKRYALRLDSKDGKGFNVYATVNNNYKQGTLYNGDKEIDNKDMVAFVVGIGQQ